MEQSMEQKHVRKKKMFSKHEKRAAFFGIAAAATTGTFFYLFLLLPQYTWLGGAFGFSGVLMLATCVLTPLIRPAEKMAAAWMSHTGRTRNRTGTTKLANTSVIARFKTTFRARTHARSYRSHARPASTHSGSDGSDDGESGSGDDPPKHKPSVALPHHFLKKLNNRPRSWLRHDSYLMGRSFCSERRRFA